MEKVATSTRLAPEIRRKLAALRWRIRGYVWLQGLSIAVIWLTATFWVGIALDYLPVMLGASEMPLVARGCLLAAIAIVLAYILYRWIGRRIWVRLADRSMALLLERQFSDIDESLITAVELADGSRGSSSLSRQMLATTQLAALRNVQRVKVAKALRLKPLLLPALLAGLLVGSIGAFYVVNASALEIGVQRIYLLDQRRWPRKAQIEVVGVEATGLATDGAAAGGTIVPFLEDEVTVARGSDVNLLVRADAEAAVVPEQCTVVYRTADSDRGRVMMTRVGAVRDGYQRYQFAGKPLKGILADVEFDVVGYDHRIRDQRIRVVDRPLIVEAELDCTFPEYIVDESTSSWLPRTVPLTTGIRLPLGTSVTLRAASNKQLKAVRIQRPGESAFETVAIAAGSSEFEHALGVLDQDVQLELTLIDFQRVTSEDPFRLYIEGVQDEPPSLQIELDGVGDAVTPDAILSLSGTISDDYGIADSWIELVVNDSQPQRLPMGTTDQVEQRVDLRQLRRDLADFRLAPGDTLRFTVNAADRYALGTGANLGVSDSYQLDVVTPDELLAMLETRELGLRQRFEQIIQETRELRDSLARIRDPQPTSETAEFDAAAEATEPAAAGTQDEAPPPRRWSLKLLRAQRAVLQAQKSAQETLGVAAAFRDIRQQLVNNRVDSEDRRARLGDQIASPLEQVGEVRFAELEDELATLVNLLDKLDRTPDPAANESPEVDAQAEASIERTDQLLSAMDQILQNMLELEGYNELLDLVRSLIAAQERLLEQTKSEQKRQLLEELVQ